MPASVSSPFNPRAIGEIHQVLQHGAGVRRHARAVARERRSAAVAQHDAAESRRRRR